MLMLYLCAEDGKRMRLVQGRFGLFYRCPGYFGKPPCYGRLALGAAELIAQMADRVQEQGELDGAVLHLQKCDVRLRKRSDTLCEAVIRRKGAGIRKVPQVYGKQDCDNDV